MNNYYIMPAALITTLIITGLVAAFFKRPIRSLWMLAILIFLATWAGQLWIPAYGPVNWGVSWISLIFMPVFFWVFVLALLPPVSTMDNSKESQEASAALGIFFWILLLALLLSIGIGYYRANRHTYTTQLQ